MSTSPKIRRPDWRRTLKNSWKLLFKSISKTPYLAIDERTPGKAASICLSLCIMQWNIVFISCGLCVFFVNNEVRFSCSNLLMPSPAYRPPATCPRSDLVGAAETAFTSPGNKPTYMRLPYIDEVTVKRGNGILKRSGTKVKVAWTNVPTLGNKLITLAFSKPPCPADQRQCPTCENRLKSNCTRENVVYKITCKMPIIVGAFRQGCARLIFSDWLDSDSYDNPGDSTPTQLKSQIC